MTLKSLRHGKCPRCCPEGGACFKLTGSREKQCQNCHLVLPFRRVKPTGKPTRSQQSALARVLKIFGGEVTKQEIIGRKLWVEIKNPARSWILGNTVYGTIGVGGQLNLKLQRLGPEAVIKNEIGVKVYLKSYL